MRARSAAAAAAGLPMLVLAAWAGARRPRARLPAAFAVPAPTGALLPASAAPNVGRTILKAEVSVEGVSAGRCAFGGAALALLAGAALRRRRAAPEPRARVGLRARGQTMFRPNAKGTKPMINRPITRDILMESMQNWRKKYKGAGDIEDIVKKHLWGKVQFQWASQTFTDEIPLVAPQGTRTGGRRDDDEDDLGTSALCVLKYREPAKFKKMAIANWEMPENYTRSVTLQELVNAGCQYGHATGVWNPDMLRYIYADFDGTHIFDLVQTAAMLNRACYYAMEAAYKGATFLFEGSKQQAKPIVREAAARTGMHYMDRFVGGLMTNFYQVRDAVKKMKKMQVLRQQGAWRVESDKKQKINEATVEHLEKKYTGVRDMKFIPDIVIFIDEVKERCFVNECIRLGVPMIGLIDTNNRPKYIDLPIPCNTSGSRSIQLVIDKLTEAIVRGQQMRESEAAGNIEEIPKEWDPWIFSRDRMRQLRRRSKRQQWMKNQYGNYENFKKAHPYGVIPAVSPYDPKFEWRNRTLRYI